MIPIPRALVFTVFFAAAFAAAAMPLRGDHIESELVAERAGVVPGKIFTLALRLKHDAHWHTYWKNPGDSGLPTTIKWKLPTGVTAGAIQWPQPTRLPLGPLVNIGYEGEVFLLTELRAPIMLKQGESLTISARADWLVCNDVCIPGGASYTITLPVVIADAVPAPRWQMGIARTRATYLLPPRDLPAPYTVAVDAAMSLPLAILFAFVGGLILNLMPCVFPVLAIKVLGFVDAAHAEASILRRQGLLFLAGVLVSFWGLVIVLLALRAAGAQLGWGFQLQSPGFIVVLAALFFLMALNLCGVFEIGARLQGVASGIVGSKNKYADAFISGVLATLMATPCTAPFMGAAIGFTLTQPMAIAGMVFTAIAIGMATPVLLLSFLPRWLRYLPRPGRWMETFRQLMAFPLFATVIWLGSVLSAEAGVQALTVLLVGLLLLGFAAWAYGRWALTAPIKSIVAAALLAAAGLGLAWQYSVIDAGEKEGARQKTGGLVWEPYSKSRLAELRTEGKPVFVEFTAAWCITCEVNRRLVLDTDAAAQAFTAKGVALLKADWTHYDPLITRALGEFGRNALPLYVLYGADAKTAPTLLPEVLTSGILLEALAKL